MNQIDLLWWKRGQRLPLLIWLFINSLRLRQNGRLFPDNTFKRIFSNENIRISTKNSMKFVPKGLINNIPALVLIMAWRRPGDKPLSEPMMVSLLTHICVTRPQWVKIFDSQWQFSNKASEWLAELPASQPEAMEENCDWTKVILNCEVCQ